jgi:hypothetical protein
MKKPVAVAIGVFLVIAADVYVQTDNRAKQKPVRTDQYTSVGQHQNSSTKDSARTTSGRTYQAARGNSSATQTIPSSQGKLKARVVGFLQNYYLIRWNDTPSTRLQRVSKFVLPDRLPLLDLRLPTGTEGDNARISQKLTQAGQVVTKSLQMVKVNKADQMLKQVLVPVVIKLTKPTGRPARPPFTLQVFSQWKYQKGNWYLLSFDKGRGDSG